VGLAYFVDGKLVYGPYVKNPVKEGGGPKAWFALADAVYADFKARGYRVDEYVCEVPQIYRYSYGDPNDLIQIAAVAAAVGAVFPVREATSYLPREWKKSINKKLHHPRIMKQLDPEEVAAIVEKRKTRAHNVIDAIGIGLFHLERTRVRFAKEL
jgi:predicted aconitase